MQNTRWLRRSRNRNCLRNSQREKEPVKDIENKGQRDTQESTVTLKKEMMDSDSNGFQNAK